MSGISQQLVLLGEELVAMIFSGTEAWLRSCRDASVDDPLLLLQPLEAVRALLRDSLQSVDGHDQLVGDLQVLVRAVARALAKLEDEPDRGSANIREQFDRALDVSVGCLQMFAHSYVQRNNGSALMEQWNRETRTLADNLLLLMCARALQADDTTGKSPNLYQQPQAMLWRIYLLNALHNLGVILEQLAPLK